MLTTNIEPNWLTQDNKIKLGAFYTPPQIVLKVRQLVEKYKNPAILLDPAGGCGAFIEAFQDWDYRVADIDLYAIQCLKSRLKPNRVFHSSALENVCRSKYEIPEKAFLVVVGNPPYNDWTSLYKKGQKGSFPMDEDVFDRDLGIAFLKAMAKLRADVICVLHPLSYLVKQANFNRLKNFFKNYILKRAIAFPSYLFKGTSRSVGFPIAIALYERNSKGWSWEDMIGFDIEVLDSNITLRMKDIETTDGLIQKYPIKGFSSLGLYFLTFRDINSLLRNRDFVYKATELTIPIEWHNFSFYAYLISLKYYILGKGSKKFWLYGNFSPLINKEEFYKLENAFVHYVLNKTRDIPLEIKESALERFRWSESMDLVEAYFSRLFAHAEGL